MGNELSGKTFSQIADEKINNKKPADYALSGSSGILYSLSNNDENKEKLSNKEALKYLKGEENTFEKTLLSLQGRADKEAISDFNKTIVGSVADFINNAKSSVNKGMDVLCQNAFEGRDGKQAEEYLKTNEGKKITAAAGEAIGKLFSWGDAQLYYKAAGIEDTLSMIKIDGKTPDELWGEKYAHVTDSKQKSELYKAEILNEVINGKNDVTVDMYLLDKKGKVCKEEPAFLCRSDETIAADKALYNNMERLHAKLVGIKERLAETQNDPQANFSGRKTEGSEYYRDMTAALRKCIELTAMGEVRNVGGTVQEITKALEKYQKASAKYVKERSSLIRAKRHNGRVRKAEAINARDSIADEIELIKIHADGDKDKYSEYTGNFNTLRVGYKKDIFDKEMQLRRNRDPEVIKEWTEVAESTTQIQLAENKKVAKKRDALRKKIDSIADEVVGPYENLDFQITGDGIVQQAKKYYKAVCYDRIKKCPDEELNDLAKEFGSKKFNDRFHKEAQNLSANPAFKKMVKAHPDTFVQGWYVAQKTGKVAPQAGNIKNKKVADNNAQMGNNGNKVTSVNGQGSKSVTTGSTKPQGKRF